MTEIVLLIVLLVALAEVVKHIKKKSPDGPVSSDYFYFNRISGLTALTVFPVTLLYIIIFKKSILQ